MWRLTPCPLHAVGSGSERHWWYHHKLFFSGLKPWHFQFFVGCTFRIRPVFNSNSVVFDMPRSEFRFSGGAETMCLSHFPHCVFPTNYPFYNIKRKPWSGKLPFESLICLVDSWRPSLLEFYRTCVSLLFEKSITHRLSDSVFWHTSAICVGPKHLK